MRNNRLKKSRIAVLMLIAVLTMAVLFGYGTPAYAAGGTIKVNVSGSSELKGQTFTFNLYKVGNFDRYAGSEESKQDKVIFTLDERLADSTSLHDLTAFIGEPDNLVRPESASDQKTWTENWIAQANTLASDLKASPEIANALFVESKPVTFGDQDQTSQIVFNNTNGLNNGLYLLYGEPEKIGIFLWTPQAMLISVLNGESVIDFSNEITDKMVKTPIVFDHTLSKHWDKDNYDETITGLVRPTKIAVRIMYGNTPIDTVVLDDSNDWMYSWKHKGPTKESTEDGEKTYITYLDNDGNLIYKVPVAEDDAGWTVSELRDPNNITSSKPTTATHEDLQEAAQEAPKLRYYTTDYNPITSQYGGAATSSNESPAEGSDTQSTTIDGKETYAITNTFGYKFLKLTKEIRGYDADMQNVTFSFKIVGKDSAGRVVYTNHVGLTFGSGDGTEKEVIVNSIPLTVTTLEITEEYSGNYKIINADENGLISTSPIIYEEENTGDDQSADENSEPVLIGWKATAKNDHNDHGPGGGVVNKYEHTDENPDQDFGSNTGSDDND